MNVNELVNQAADADQYDDQTQETSNFDDGPAPAGWTPARFVGYVEVGKRKQKPFQGKPKADCMEVRMYFELNGPKHRREIEVDGVKRTVTNMQSIKMALKVGDKASFSKLMKKMVYGREGIKHMASMLGQGFLIKIEHNTVAKTEDKPERTFANMKDADGNWLIGPPTITDPMTEVVTNVAVPEISVPIKLLLLKNPTKEQWESIFIDGTRTVKDAKGVETEQSKNWLQEDIVQNMVGFEGSALQTLVSGVGDLNLNLDPGKVETPEEEVLEPVTPAEAPKTPVEAAPVVDPAVEPKQTKQDVSGAPDASPADIMADLGL
ncbi:hypothetical protein SAMN05216227_102057 [Pseudorhodobacter antarcticus]|uniref:Uncharacterized protein n=1 Tax=Pseudorhodobacter antarcticus TaxID=1077947 RepID=A0A1H8IHN8_9RHOB|nr:hypothetical protein [Pseudorhodobacter antarcticus]SEN68400.1 hypothetical protein SAMN05216227_102057 [Pseudorhodobacter antarcticus]